MTKCPKCKFYNICKGRINETVENCVRFKSTEQTNEEWFDTLSTKEKAEWLTEFGIRFIPCELTVLPEKTKTYKNNILEWLKEKHDG